MATFCISTRVIDGERPLEGNRCPGEVLVVSLASPGVTKRKD
jgi:hypothetical protein